MFALDLIDRQAPAAIFVLGGQAVADALQKPRAPRQLIRRHRVAGPAFIFHHQPVERAFGMIAIQTFRLRLLSGPDVRYTEPCAGNFFVEGFPFPAPQ